MMASIFDRFARWTERQLGHPVTFAVACLSIVLWGVTGPFSAGGPSPSADAPSSVGMASVDCEMAIRKIA
jgi:hypothetical protein